MVNKIILVVILVVCIAAVVFFMTNSSENNDSIGLDEIPISISINGGGSTENAGETDSYGLMSFEVTDSFCSDGLLGVTLVNKEERNIQDISANDVACSPSEVAPDESFTCVIEDASGCTGLKKGEEYNVALNVRFDFDTGTGGGFTSGGVSGIVE